MTRSPISALMMAAPAPIAQSRPMRTSGPITAPAAITVPRADLGARTDHCAGIDRHAILQPGGRMHVSAGATPSPRTKKTAAANSGNSERVDRRRTRDKGSAQCSARMRGGTWTGEPLAGQADLGLRRGQTGGKFRLVEEDQIVRAGAIEWRDVGDAAVERRAVTRHRARQRDNLANRQAGAVA